MLDSHPLPLPHAVKLTIIITNLPFLAIEYACTPIVHAARSTRDFLRRLCQQNWIFLCIFYLHLWQLVLDSPPIRPIRPHWRLIVASTLFLACAVPAGMILHASVSLFRDFWRESSGKRQADVLQPVAFFVVALAPACAVASAAVTAVCYVWKNKKHSKY